jgi:hypothetical protein
MSDRLTDPSLQDINTRTLIVAAALCAISAILGLSGVALAVGAVVGAGRRWYRRADLTPQQLARLKWEQAKAAAAASAGAWRDAEQEKYSPRSRTSSVT